MKNLSQLDSPRNNLIYDNEFNFVDSSYNKSAVHINYRGANLNNTATKITDYYFDDGQKGTGNTQLHGTVDKADKLKTARTIGIGTGATGTATSFDGSSNITIPITDVKDAYVTWGGKAMTTLSPDDMGCIDEFGHNKLAFLPADCITVEYTTTV